MIPSLIFRHVTATADACAWVGDHRQGPYDISGKEWSLSISGHGSEYAPTRDAQPVPAVDTHRRVWLPSWTGLFCLDAVAGAAANPSREPDRIMAELT
jgi:hypothetical protein